MRPLLPLALLLLVVSPTAAAPDEVPRTAAIVVRVGALRNDVGVLGCDLYAQKDGFPDRGGFRAATSPIHDGRASCVFSGLAPGTYAVTVIHDEDEDGDVRVNFLGIPLEGYGFSNNRAHAFRAPTWEESSFRVNAGEQKVLDVAIRY
jgi:uncharacterized protein (DUF2141 family)